VTATIAARPSFVVSPTDKVVGAGRRLSVKCVVTGSPSPAVYWSVAATQVGYYTRLLVTCSSYL